MTSKHNLVPHASATERLESFERVIDKITNDKKLHTRSSSQTTNRLPPELNFRRHGGKPSIPSSIREQTTNPNQTKFQETIFTDIKSIFDDHAKKQRFKENKQEIEVLQIQKERTEIDEILRGLQNRDKSELFKKEKESKALSDEVSKMFLQSKPELERKEQDRINQIKEIHNLQKDQEDLQKQIKEGNLKKIDLISFIFDLFYFLHKLDFL